MCKSEDPDLNELDELLSKGNYDICQGFDLALHYNNKIIAHFLAERGAIDLLESKGTPEKTLLRIRSFFIS